MGLRGKGAKPKKPGVLPKKRPRVQPWTLAKHDRAGRVVAFLQWLPVTKGKLAGKRMRLLPPQRQFIESIYGDLATDGRRNVRLGVKSEPKGNGKTGLAAGLALCHLLGPESERRGEVYSAAIDRDQAGIMFEEMEAIITAVPEFDQRVNVQRFKKKIEVLSGDGIGSKYEAMSADARKGHAISPSFWVYDELAQARGRELLDNLLNAMGKRDDALGLVISTQSPDDNHPMSQLIDDAQTSGDPSIVLQLDVAPDDADPFEEKTWRACNPALGKFLDAKEFRQAAARAKRRPELLPAFLNLRLNMRIDSNADARIATRAQWELGDMPVDLRKLEGRECSGGLDLSKKDDLTSLVLAFPDDSEPTGFDIVPFFWTPADALNGRRPLERDLFKQWIAAGYMTAVPGPVIRYGWVAAKLAELAGRFDIRAVGYDRWKIDEFKIELADIGGDVPLESFGQGFRDMEPALDYFAELALTGGLRHGGHPVLTACVANAIVVTDPAGNRKFDKEKSNTAATVRIDGAVALAMALGTARRHVAESQEMSSWEDDDYDLMVA